LNKDISANKIKRGPLDGLSRHKKRLKIAREEDKKEMAQQAVSARKAKKDARPDRIPQFNSSSGSSVKSGQTAKKKKSNFDSELKGSGKGNLSVKQGSGVEKKNKGGVKKKKTMSNKSFKSLSKHKRRK
jgi:hypothetical protein